MTKCRVICPDATGRHIPYYIMLRSVQLTPGVELCYILPELVLRRGFNLDPEYHSATIPHTSSLRVNK